MVLVAFQGESGSTSENALLAYFEARGFRAVESLPAPGFEEALRHVEEGDAQYAFLPIENTHEGTIQDAVTALLASDLFIVGEMRYKLAHALIGQPGASLESVRRVFSHSYALRQCREFLRAHHIEAVPATDTAGAVRQVKARGDPSEAAIASERAAQLHGMQVIRRNVQSRHSLFTRFVALATSEYKSAASRREKEAFLTTILFTARHRPGALHACLGEFARRDINLTRLESRPRSERPWTYEFFVDFEGHREEPRVQEALSALIGNSSSLRVLGSYPMWQAPKPTPQ